MKIYIAENIRNLRKKYNMKQEQLAEALDVSITAVSKWEREMTTPELKYIVEMAAMEAAEKFMQEKVCGEQILCLWSKLKGEQPDETLE